MATEKTEAGLQLLLSYWLEPGEAESCQDPELRAGGEGRVRGRQLLWPWGFSFLKDPWPSLALFPGETNKRAPNTSPAVD